MGLTVQYARRWWWRAIALLPVLAAAQTAGPAPKGDVHRGPINLPEVVRRATLIARGTVTGSRVEWVDRTIYTFHELIVSETVKGATRTNVTVAVPGGAIGNVQTVWPGAPRISTGDELVFFGTPLRGGPSWEAVGLFDGLVEIHTDPASGNRLVSPRGRPEKVEDFLSEVRGLSHP
jgi:hypothetical protein